MLGKRHTEYLELRTEAKRINYSRNRNEIEGYFTAKF